MRKLVLAMAVCLSVMGCVVEPAHADPVFVQYEVVVPSAPPVEIVEVVPVAPGPRYIWCRGHWHWTGSHYVWVRGKYIGRVHGRVWVHPHYVYRGRWIHVRGHWR